LIVGAPVYTGKLPRQVIQCLEVLNGKGKECTAVVVYGNRDYGIALRHMAKLLTKKGFKVNAAGAFIGQHSYSKLIPVAIGRPDKKDLEFAEKFGTDCLDRSEHLSIKKIPAQIDMISKSKGYMPLNPVFNTERCTNCGTCAAHCPTGIISAETGNYINKKAKKDCVGCMACVFGCENAARTTEAGFFMKALVKFILRKAAVERLEPTTIFP
jgi:Pyruvate/2-oxoacid:ferredoxin oxidoreductase delta subunit